MGQGVGEGQGAQLEWQLALAVLNVSVLRFRATPLMESQSLLGHGVPSPQSISPQSISPRTAKTIARCPPTPLPPTPCAQWVLLPLRTAERQQLRLTAWAALEETAHKLPVQAPPRSRWHAWFNTGVMFFRANAGAIDVASEWRDRMAAVKTTAEDRNFKSNF